MSTTLRRIVGGGCLVALGCGLVIGTAAADPGACFIDRGVTDAVALCHEGDGAARLEVECLGISVAQGSPVFGPYSGTDSAPSAVGRPMRASCVSDGMFGITTRAFVR